MGRAFGTNTRLVVMKDILPQLALLFLFVSCFQSEKANFDSGVLWRIESKKGVESFIFGTIHLYPRTEMELSEKVISKLQDCNVLALERDITNQSEQQKFADFEMPSFLLESYRVIIDEYGDELISMESELIEKANESEIKLTGLESSDEILNIMQTVRNIKVPENTFIKEEMLADYQKSLKLYETESIGRFNEIMTIQMGEEITKILVDKRNDNWIGDIESLIDQDKTFIAVGMGHLGGENGILNLLSEKGYRLKRVK